MLANLEDDNESYCKIIQLLGKLRCLCWQNSCLRIAGPKTSFVR